MEKIIKKLWIIDIKFSELPRITTHYVCRSRKLYMIYVYLPIR